MDSTYRKIAELKADYIKLNYEFIDALIDAKPSEYLAILKNKILVLASEIEILETQRESGKDEIPG